MTIFDAIDDLADLVDEIVHMECNYDDYRIIRDAVDGLTDFLEEQKEPCNVCEDPKGKRCLIMNAYEVLQAGTMKYCPNRGRELWKPETESKN